ncbi:hypothetical protein [Patulibacter sp. SYSU D01012]|uniref:DUF7933 domain-containing protein n=1 Tax=Patulibacter sp. SYSU D01012 TaxID=2817381 RepID=UPI001B314C00|nr:hypothetical protein [Patulibacter sp. SYSU D01012]
MRLGLGGLFGVAAAAVLLAAVPAPAGAMTGGNLVVGGDGETAPGPEWTAQSGGLVRQLYGRGGYPGPVLIGGGTFAGGAYLLHGPNGVPVSVVRQTIALGADDVAAIDTGTVRGRLSAFLGGYNAQQDRTGVVAEWRDADGATLLRQELQPVLPAERGNVTGFVARRAEDAVPVGTRSVLVTVTATLVTAPQHDGYVDDIAVHLIGIPRMESAFSAPSAPVGRPTVLTLTVRNSEDVEAKPAWRLTQDLPAGLTVASQPLRTDCAGATVRADSPSRVSVTGATGAGDVACSVRVPVVPARAGTFVVRAADATVDGLHAPAADATLRAVDPAPAPDPAGPPAATDAVGSAARTRPAAPVPEPPVARTADRRPLRVAVAAPARVRAGGRARLAVRVTNRTAATVRGARICVVLPRGVRLAAGARPCVPVAALGPRAARRRTFAVRLERRAPATLRVRARATAPGRVAATAVRGVRVERPA